MLLGVSFLIVAALICGVAVCLFATHKVVLGRAWPASERVSIDAINHQQWDGLLNRYVDSSGDVDYGRWKATPDDLRLLNDYLESLSRADPSRESKREARLAFWTNAYNAVTVQGILREYPTPSIQDHVSHWLGFNIWRDLLLQVGAQQYSLGEIEHSILRKMDEPRIHFAIVCGSRGCPVLRKEAYEPKRMESQLQENARQFFADPTKFSYDRDRKLIQLSPILDWYAKDFGQNDEERLKKIAPYLPEDAARELSHGTDVKLTYPSYDWRLNEKASQPEEPPLPPDPPDQSEEPPP